MTQPPRTLSIIPMSFPNGDEPGWRERAACLAHPALLFFGFDEAENPGEKRAREDAAKAVCASCPVMRDCLEYALETREPYGIWGGLTESERKAEIRKRARRAIR